MMFEVFEYMLASASRLPNAGSAQSVAGKRRGARHFRLFRRRHAQFGAAGFGPGHRQSYRRGNDDDGEGIWKLGGGG